MINKKYFHELTEEEFNKLPETMTVNQLNEEYCQPEWCNYPDALGLLGCWSLISRMVKEENYCRNCDCHLTKNA